MGKYYTDNEDSWKDFAFSNLTGRNEGKRMQRGKIYFIPDGETVEIQNYSAVALTPIVINVIKAYAAEFQIPMVARHKNWRSTDLSAPKSRLTDLTKLEITAGDKVVKIYTLGRKSATICALDNLMRRAMRNAEDTCVLIHLYNLKFPRQSALEAINKRLKHHASKTEIHLVYNGEYWQKLQ